MLLILGVLKPGLDDRPVAEFDAIFRQLYSPVVGYFLSKRLAREESEELAQETFLRGFRSFDSYRGEAKPSSWIFAIANNLWRNRLRDRGAAKRSGDEEPIEGGHLQLASVGTAAIDRVVEAEKQRFLADTIEKLPPRMRQCVKLRVYQDMSFRDIAEVLGIGESAAKSQVSLACGKLRQALEPRYPELAEAFDE